jgi:phospholipase/lecithinase/hemolysin
MRKFLSLSLIILFSAQIVADRAHYRSLVFFGDDLSDVGTYKVGSINALGGGKYTINFPGGKIWIDRLAQELCLPTACAALTGIDGTAFGMVPVANHPECLGYAQGGARVSNAVGIGNAASSDLLSPLGALTNPVVSQITQHLFLFGNFRPRDLVTVWAGTNDILANLGAESGVDNVKEAAQDLARYIKDLILANGADRVVVLGIPDLRFSPFGLQLSPADRSLLNELVMTFNNNLAFKLSDVSAPVLLLDLYAQTHLWFNNLQDFSLSNMTSPACNLAALVLPTSLLCTQATLVPGDTSRYFYADLINPAPKGSEAIANFVIKNLKTRGWLPR